MGPGSSPSIRADYATGKSRVILEDVTKGFGEAWEYETVIENLSLEIPPGELTAVVGPSGCGKSTLVALVAGYERPESGRILLDDRRISGPGHDRMVVFQETALLPWQTTYENLVFGPRLRGELRGGDLHRKAEALLDKVGLRDFKDKYPLQLSGGMQRRAELARALMNDPRLLIMDEPFRGLDAMTRPLMQEFFLRLFEENRRTNLFVTSEIEEAIFLADRLVVLTNRPARVRAIINIDLPRPRQHNMVQSREAFEYRRQAMEMLHEEAAKSFKTTARQADFVKSFSAGGGH